MGAWGTLVRHLESQLDAERAATARVLHDELGGLLVAAKMDLADLQRSLGAQAPSALGAAQRAQRGVELAIATERRLVETLQPGLLVHVGLIAALRGHLEYFRGPEGRRVHAMLPVEEAELPLPRRTALYQAVKEALELACEHAAESLTLAIAVASDVITVRLAPFAVPEQPAADARLLAIRHRLQSLRGTAEMALSSAGQRELVLRAPCLAA
jgi:signal transduction histidine kinase